MSISTPSNLENALVVLAGDPDTQVLAGGTDFMVEVNFGHRRPTSVLSLGRCRELRRWHYDGSSLVIGSGVTYRDLAHPELAGPLPALAAAARTVGSPQIRNAGTIGGNVATASPAGDTLPVLAALDASIELRSAARGTRVMPWTAFFLGVKRTARETDELVTAVHVPIFDSAQEYLKVGTRNAMVISVAGLCAVVDFAGHNVRCAMGSVGPVPLRARDAEAWVADHTDWETRRIADPRTYETFASMVADAARPIDDHRSTAQYRRHAIGVLAKRALMRMV